MSTEIYYFTGTGNSLVVARDIARKTNGKLISIPFMMGIESLTTNADMIGIVFPVYYATNGCSGIPLIVEKFLNKLKNIGSKYIFAVCTHSGMPGVTIEKLSKIIKSRGGKLAAGFTVKLNNPPSVFEKLKKSIFHKKLKDTAIFGAQERQQKVFDHWKKKLQIIYDYISNKKEGMLETRNKLSKLFFAPLLFLLIKPVFSSRYKKLSNSLNLPFKEMIPLADRSYQYDEKCNGCGICARICPVNNIKMINSRPVWQHYCENCFACYVWCPSEAIDGDIVSYAERYHHPDVKVTDMIKSKL